VASIGMSREYFGMRVPEGRVDPILTIEDEMRDVSGCIVQ
jgi:hypothetical protein